MIPKIIKYVWSNDDDNFYYLASQNSSIKIARICYTSWKLNLSGYEIIELNEWNFDYAKHFKKSNFFKFVYEHKLWAFVADYIRVHDLYLNGGIYLDTDVQVLRNFDKFLQEEFFISFQHWKHDGRYCIEPAVMGCNPGHPLLKEVISFYENEYFIQDEPLTIPVVFQKCMEKLYGFRGNKEEVLNDSEKLDLGLKTSKFPDEYFAQKIVRLSDITIYPEEYFCPKWMSDSNEKPPGSNAITEKTHCIHWCNSSWINNNSIDKLKSFQNM